MVECIRRRLKFSVSCPSNLKHEQKIYTEQTTKKPKISDFSSKTNFQVAAEESQTNKKSKNIMAVNGQLTRKFNSFQIHSTLPVHNARTNFSN